MQARPINPVVKTVLEFGPALIFFAAYMWLKEESFTIAGTEYSGFILVTAGFVPVLLVSIYILWRLAGRISRMQLFTAIMVIVFGGLTVWFNNEQFFKMKTTIVYGSFAAILFTGLALKRSWLEYVMGEILPMRHAAWVKIETFGFPLILFLFLWSQIVALQPYVIEEETPKGE